MLTTRPNFEAELLPRKAIEEEPLFDVQLEVSDVNAAPIPHGIGEINPIKKQTVFAKTNLASITDDKLAQDVDAHTTSLPIRSGSNGDNPQNPSPSGSTPAQTTSTATSKLCYLLQNAWWGIQSLSEWVTEFVGITSPRYEMYMDDSIEFLQSTQEDVEDEQNYVKITMET
jgi:hypothetical protein